MKTFPRVYELLQKESRAGTSVNAIVRKTGITHNTIMAYLEGRAEPTQRSLEKLAKTYHVTVAWLRGDTDELLTLPPDVVELGKLSPAKRRLWETLNNVEDSKIEGVLALLRTLLPTQKTR